MTGNTTARTQAIELGERLREVAAWNVRLHLAKEELEQQALCEATGVTKATISARMNLDAAWDLNAIAAAAVTLGMPPAELLDDTLYDIVNNDDTNTNEGKGASLVAADLDAPGTPHRRQVQPVENKRLLPNHNDGDRSKSVPPERV